MLKFGGQNVPQLLKAIERNIKRFHRPPIGPIGSLLSLDDDQYALAVEAAIGRSFNQFIVHSHEDMELLKVKPISNCQNARAGARAPPLYQKQHFSVNHLLRKLC